MNGNFADYMDREGVGYVQTARTSLGRVNVAGDSMLENMIKRVLVKLVTAIDEAAETTGGATDESMISLRVSSTFVIHVGDNEGTPPLNIYGAEAPAILRCIDTLRAEEGSSVMILCDNPDFNGQPARVVEVCAEWTDWKDRRFGGDTLLKALQSAVKAKTTCTCQDRG